LLLTRSGFSSAAGFMVERQPGGLMAASSVEDSALLQAALTCVDEWSDCLSRLRGGELPALCNFRPWGSDFDHQQTWTISPLILGAGSFTKINAASPEMALLLPLYLRQVYPKTYLALAPWITAERLNYVAFSKLGPGAVLRAHRHSNAGCAKLHIAVEEVQKCGLMFHQKRFDGRLQKKINHWSRRGQHCFFDDNYVHSAWNFSGAERVVILVDYVV